MDTVCTVPVRPLLARHWLPGERLVRTTSAADIRIDQPEVAQCLSAPHCIAPPGCSCPFDRDKRNRATPTVVLLTPPRRHLPLSDLIGFVSSHSLRLHRLRSTCSCRREKKIGSGATRNVWCARCFIIIKKTGSYSEACC